MAVLLETSAGNLVVDLYAEKCPTACLNFVKLCKMHYYDGHLFFDVQRNYWVRTGDPTGTGKGGQSVFSLLENKDADDTASHSKYFADEIVRGAKFDRRGLVCMASTMKDQNGSSFMITMTDHGLEHLNGTRTIFGEIGEGLDSTLAAINELQVDDKYRPLRDVRILCTHVLDDPFPDPPGLPRPQSLPAGARPPQECVEPRIGFDENLDEDVGVSTEELEKRSKARDAKARAVVLEMVGDLPDADMKPPENVLFVCKLNAATQEDDLELIFSRFGEVKSCEIIRDKETGDSLQYAFIEFGNEEQCQEAFFKMNNVMIDDRRIKVDFSQSVSKLWNDARRGTRRRLPPSFSTGRDERSRYHERAGPRSHQNHHRHRHVRDAEHHVHSSREEDRRSHFRENRNAGELSREGRHSNKRTAGESHASESESGSDSGSSISSRDRKRRRRDDRGRRKHHKKHKSRSGEKKKKSRKHESEKKHKKHKKHKSSRRD